MFKATSDAQHCEKKKETMFNLETYFLPKSAGTAPYRRVSHCTTTLSSTGWLRSHASARAMML